MIYIKAQVLSYIIFGGFLLTVVIPFVYRELLSKQMRGCILGEFWDSKGDRDFIPCKIIRETNGVAEVEPPRKHKKENPSIKNYFTRRDCVDRTQWPNKPIWSFMSIRVPVCSWEVGCVEPIDPRKEHRDYPITTASGFIQGIREEDQLLGYSALTQTAKELVEDVNKTLAGLNKAGGGNKQNKNTMIIGFVILGLVIIGIGIAVYMYMSSKFGGLGL